MARNNPESHLDVQGLEKLDSRYQELEGLLASPEVVCDKQQYNRYAKELSDIQEAVYLFRQYRQACREIQDLQQVIKEKADKELLELAKTELVDLGAKKASLEERIKESLTQDDKDLGKDMIVEIRQGTGGSEAGLFATDLYRM